MQTQWKVAWMMVFVFSVGLGVPDAYGLARPGDNEITYWVRDAFSLDPRIDASRITVNTKDGVVTLSGIVDNLAAKLYADREGKKISGVLGIINQIEVKPASRLDTDIAQDVKRRILNSAVIESQSISVSCRDGRVTLRGKVASWSEKLESQLLASEVRGVKEVIDLLRISEKAGRSDQAIKDDVLASLHRDVYLTGFPITVRVKKGRVTLSGWVGNAYEKERAGNTARWTGNVHGVSNKLTVKWWKDRDIRAHKTGPVKDSTLREAVNDELRQDSRLDSADISVDAVDGIVMLNGSVPNHYQKHMAGLDARNVVGAAFVENDLYVYSKQRSDESILNDVMFNLNSDYRLGKHEMKILVRDNVVTLSGKVRTLFDSIRAEDIASRVRGVKKVVNHIQVVLRLPKSSKVIVKDIRSHLKSDWLTSSVSDKIGVEVADGVAQLSGRVKSWAQRREAENVAYGDGGIWMVVNDLHVEGYDHSTPDNSRYGVFSPDPLSSLFKN